MTPNLGKTLSPKPRRQPLDAQTDLYFDLFQRAPVGYFILSGDGRIQEANLTLAALLGEPPGALSRQPFAPFVCPADQPLFDRFVRTLAETGTPQTCELRLDKTDGTQLWAQLAAVPDAPGSATYRVALCDLTRFKHAEQFLCRLYGVLAQVNQAIVHFQNRDELLREICRIAVQFGGFPFAWIGLADAGTRLLRPLAHAGREEGFLKSIHVNVNPDSAFSQGPIGQAYLQNQVVASNESDSAFQRSPWCTEMLKRGFRSLAAVPFRLNGAVVGTLNLYVEFPCVFTAEELDLLKRIGGTLSFALDALEIEKSRRRAEAALRESEAQNRAYIRAIPDLIFMNDRAGEYLAVHAPDADLLAAPPETILHRRIHDLLPKPVADRCLAAVVAALDSRALQKVTYVLPFDDQKRRFEARIAPCTSTTVLTIVRDITELAAPAPPPRRRKKPTG
ncbi:MAG: GAF domain-containing protein [Kiritimatiellia bacterium]